MSMSLIVVVVIVVVAIALWYSMSNQKNEDAANIAQRITPQQYQTGYATRDHLLVDVRTPEEFATGHIPGAVNIALQSLPQHMATLPHDQPIVLYCRSGARSREAVNILTQSGFNDIHDLGGITEWRNQGLPVS
jgi:phage shock protein E